MKLAWKGFEIITFHHSTLGFNWKTSLNPSTCDQLRLKVDREDDQHHKNEGCLKRFLNWITSGIFSVPAYKFIKI